MGFVLTFGPTPADSYYLPTRHAGGGNILDYPGLQSATDWDEKLHPIEQEIIDNLDVQGKRLTFHHANFDLRFLYRLGMRKLQASFFDTMVNAALLDEFQSFYSLEFCCKLAGVAAKKSEEIKAYLISKFPEAAAQPKAAMGQFFRLRGDDSIGVVYAEGDGTSTYQLAIWQQEELRKQELLRVWDIESRLIPVLARMSSVGIKIDTGLLAYLLDPNKVGSIDFQLNRLIENFPDGFNFRSPNDVMKWCTDAGRTDWPMTPKGRPSFPSAWLETHEAGRKIVTVRQLLTLRDTFLIPMKETHLWKGRVHTTFNQLRGDEYGTITGRLSASDPNLTAVTKHNKFIGKIHRSIFIPDEGMVWAQADYSQMEPRLLAHYSQAPVLLNGYRSNPPVDAHTSVSEAMNPNWEFMTAAERKKYRDDIGKRVNMTIVTGGGKKVLVEKYGVSQADADKGWDAYFDKLPQVKTLQRRAAQKMQREKFVFSLLGRRARLGPDGRSYVAVNRLLQGGNADALKTKLVQIDEYLESIGRPVNILNAIHDDIAFEFAPKDRSWFNECIMIMTDFGPGQPIELSVPIAVDIGIGNSWATATFGEEK